MDYKDNGYKSRKMVMAYVSITLITLAYIATGVFPALVATFGTFIAGILAATTIFTGANTAIDYMAHQANIANIQK